jgi:cell division septation protein DedD
MANMGRSTYEPPDDIYVFDGAEDDEDVEGSRLPLLIVIALFVLAAFAGVVYLAYTQGVARGRSDVPRIIAAQPGPAKVAVNEGQDASGPGTFKGLKIYQQPAPSDEAQDRQTAQLPPAPDQAQIAAPETTPATPPKPEAVAVKEPPLSVAKSLVPPAAPTVSKPAPPPAPATEQVASAEPAPSTAKAPAGAYVLQIGAYKSDEEASAAWRTYHAKHASLLSGYSEDVKKVDLGEKGTWYRLRVGSFMDKDAAKGLCAKLTAEGGACFPAK